jgi:hypothetical protein
MVVKDSRAVTRAAKSGALNCGPGSSVRTGLDRYGRYLGTCFIEGEDVGRWLVRNGWALAFRRYSNAYVQNEDYAREHQLGLWSGAFIIRSTLPASEGQLASTQSILEIIQRGLKAETTTGHQWPPIIRQQSGIGRDHGTAKLQQKGGDRNRA